MAAEPANFDLEHLAALAHLDLSPEEQALFRHQLVAILDYAAQIRTLDTTGVAPTSHVLSRGGPAGTDQIAPSLSQAEALQNAPETAPAAGLFRVPRVLRP